MHHALPRLVVPGRLSNFADDVRYVYRQRNLDKAPISLVWLLLLAACGGGGGGGGGGTSKPETSGVPETPVRSGGTFSKSLTVYDPPIGGAPIWVDVDGDRTISDGDVQLSGRTQPNGDITVQIPNIHRQKNLIADFRDKTNLKHDGPLNSDFYVAPAESSVISVFTHAFMNAGVAPGRMQGELQSLSSRVGGFDPLNHNPYNPTARERALYDPEIIQQSLPQLELWLKTALRPVRGDIAEFRKEVQSAISKIFDCLDAIQQQQQQQQDQIAPPPADPVIETPPQPPVLTVTRAASQPRIEETPNEFTTSRIDTGITVEASDADGDLQPLVIESWQPGDIWQADPRFVVSGGRLYIEQNSHFDFESANNPDGVIRLRITASDSGERSVQRHVTVQLTNVDEVFPSFLRIDGLNAGNEVQPGNQVTANVSDITDPDGQPEFTYEWFRDGTKIPNEDGRSLTPDQAGHYRLKVSITDPVFRTVTTQEFAFTATAPQPLPPVAPSVPQAAEPGNPPDEPPQPQQPPRIQLSATSHEWTEGTEKPTTLATITILDESDSEFLVTVAGGTQVRYFEIVRISRTAYELRLKPSTDERDIPSSAPLFITVGRDIPGSDTAKAWFNFTSLSPQSEPPAEDEPEVVEEVVVDQKPTNLLLEPTTLAIKEGQTPSAALTTITIVDDGEGFVRLHQLPHDSIFSLRQIGATRFELHLKSRILVDQDLVGSHVVELRALGTGVSSGPEPRQTFTLHVQTELTVTEPSATERPVITETIGDENTTQQIDTGITVRVDELGGTLNPLKIESRVGGTWREDNRFEVADGRLHIKSGVKIDFEHPGNPGGIVRLRLSVTDDTGRNVHREVNVHLANVNEPATGEVSIRHSATGHQAGQQLVAESQSDDPDGIRQQQITWKKDGNVINGPDGRPVTGSTFTPTEAGHYQAILTVTDAQDNEQTFRSGVVNVTVAEAEPETNPPGEVQQPPEIPVVPQPPQQQEPDRTTPQDPALSVTGRAFLVERSPTYEDTPTGLSYVATDPNGDTPSVTLLNEGDIFVLKNGQIFARAGAELVSGRLYNLQLQAVDNTDRTVIQTTEVLVKSNLLSVEINEWRHQSGQWADFEDVLRLNAVPEKTVSRAWKYNVVPYKLFFPRDKSFDFVIKSNWNGDVFTEDDRFFLHDLINRETLSDGQGGYRYTERSFKFIRVHLNKDFDFEHSRGDGSHLPPLYEQHPFAFRKLSLQIVATNKATGEKYTSQTFYYAIQNVDEPTEVINQPTLEEQAEDGSWEASDGVLDYGQRVRITGYEVTDPDLAPEYAYRWFVPGASSALQVDQNVFEPSEPGEYAVEAVSIQQGSSSSRVTSTSDKLRYTVNEIPEGADLKPTDFSLKIDNGVAELQTGLAALNAGGTGPKNGRIGTIRIQDDNQGTNEVHLTPQDDFTRANDLFKVYLKAGETNIFRIKLENGVEWSGAPAGWYHYSITVTGTGLGFQPTKEIKLGIWLQDPSGSAQSSGSTGLIGQGPPEVDRDFLPVEPLSDDGGMGGMPDIL